MKDGQSEHQGLSDLEGVEWGDGERSVKHAEQLHRAGPEALVLERHLFPQQ
jgi:hypothetical protein